MLCRAKHATLVMSFKIDKGFKCNFPKYKCGSLLFILAKIRKVNKTISIQVHLNVLADHQFCGCKCKSALMTPQQPLQQGAETRIV